jgi:hypothetical protein
MKTSDVAGASTRTRYRSCFVLLWVREIFMQSFVQVALPEQLFLRF